MSAPGSPQGDGDGAAPSAPRRRVLRDDRRAEARDEPARDEPGDVAAQLADAAADLGTAPDAASPRVGDPAEEAAAEVESDFELAAVARQRDDYLDALRRLQADFENYRKRVERQRVEEVERAAGQLVMKLLPVCDTVDLAVAHGGGEEVKQIWTALFETLEKAGLVRLDPVGFPFDPTLHDAVAHEPGDGSSPAEVAEVMRAGYLWKGRVLRPAMVKVRG